LDEPTNGLDPAGIRELRDYLRKLAKDEGIAVFVSSHLLSEMELMCDRVAIIQNGRLIDVRSLQDGEQALSARRVLFQVDRPAEAVQALQTAGQSAELAEKAQEADSGVVIIYGDRDGIATANAALAGIRVYGIREDVKSLEDQFLEVTGGEKIG
jgi:ABC-2 type transport system ATP-binding protein